MSSQKDLIEIAFIQKLVIGVCGTKLRCLCWFSVSSKILRLFLNIPGFMHIYLLFLYVAIFPFSLSSLIILYCYSLFIQTRKFILLLQFMQNVLMMERPTDKAMWTNIIVSHVNVFSVNLSSVGQLHARKFWHNFFL